MATIRSVPGTAAFSAAALASIILLATLVDGRALAQAPAIDADDIGGVVTSATGPEAGVWVIAETNAFQTRFAKIVVTDDRGRYVVPDLPAADYQLWVRGYGLADSDKVAGSPGKTVNLTAKVAPSPAIAAQVYPAIYWYSMQKVPSADEVKNLSRRRESVPRVGQEPVVHRLPPDRPARDARTCLPSSVMEWKAGCGAFSLAKQAARCSRLR